MPPQADAIWTQAVVEATWETKQYPLGGSADDAGIGAQSVPARKIMAVTLRAAGWGKAPPLDQAWYDAHYPGAQFIEVNAVTPQELQQKFAAT